MARDWVKMRTDLYRDPKVSALADALFDLGGQLALFVSQNMQRQMTITRNVTRNTVMGALVSVWGVMRHRGKREGDDLVLRGMSIEVIDDVCDIPGFGHAMAAVGWVIRKKEGIVFPNFFEENNVEPENSSRSKAAERQARYRQKKASQSDDSLRVTSDVTSDVTLRSREEREREYLKQEQIPLSPPVGTVTSIHPVQPMKGSTKRLAEPDGFAEFYALYPRKVGRPKAAQAFAKLTLGERRMAITVIAEFADSWKWRNEPEFIPHPTTWLNQARWNDEPPPREPPRQPQTKLSRQGAIAAELLKDHRYADTAQRQLAHERDSGGLPAINGTFAALSAGPGGDLGDDAGLDGRADGPRHR